jgi:ATP-binding cassette subfamily F protein 3
VITLRKLSLRRGAKLLLDGVDLALHPGERVGVVGPNGCGKSSLFARSAATAPDGGDISCRPAGQ